MLILSTLRKDALYATEPGILKTASVKLAGDRGMCSLPSLQEYAIYATDQGTWIQEFVELVEAAAGLYSEYISPQKYYTDLNSDFCVEQFSSLKSAGTLT